MKAFILIITSLTLLLMYSCNEDPIESSVNDGINITTSSTFTNPYDSIGIVHNLILNEMISLQDDFYEVCDSADFHDKFIEVLAEATCDVGWYTPSTNCQTTLEINIENLLNSMYSGYTDLDDMLQTELSTAAYNKANDLLDFFDNVSSYSNHIANIEAWEEEVYNSTTFTSGEKGVLLRGGSIARHSSAFWHAVENNQNHAWRYNPNCADPSMKSKFKLLSLSGWEKVAVTDVAYGLGTATKLWITGPAVTLSAVVGATVGASATAAVIEFWDDISDGISKAANWLKFWGD